MLDLAPVVLAACLVAGFGLTYLAGDALGLSLEERLFYGAVAGAMVVAGIGFLLALAIGLTGLTVLAAAGLGIAVSGAGWWRARRRLPAEAAALRVGWRARWPLLAVLAVAWAYTLALAPHLYTSRPDGLYAGTLGVWGDWAAHLAYAGSFAYGANFPPQFPIDPGHRLGYPFMVDFFAAMLVAAGSALPAALTLSTTYLALAFPAVMYLAGLRLLGERFGAALAVFVFALQGGLGFVYFFNDLAGMGPGVLLHLPREYTHIQSLNYQWLNPVLANLLPQRSTLFGFPVVLIVLGLLFSARALPGPAWTPFLAAGVLTGLLPAFHVHSWGTLIALPAFWAALNPRREWFAYFLPALLLGLPAVAWLLPPARPPCGFPCLFGFPLLPGWLAMADGAHDNPLWFWLKNLGVFIPLLLVAQLWPSLLRAGGRGPSRLGREGRLEGGVPPQRGLALHLAPVWLWFLVPNLVQLHVWDWDNNKFLIFWALLGAYPVGALLARLFASGRTWLVPAVALSLLLGLAGTLDLARTLDSRESALLFTDSKGVRLAAWARSETPPQAVFLTSTDHNEPVPSLGGRRVVMGYTGWVWSYGLTDWPAKEADVHAMLRGSPETPALLKRYGVSYVVVGPQERAAPYLAQDAYWALHGQVVYNDGEYTVYKVSS